MPNYDNNNEVFRQVPFTKETFEAVFEHKKITRQDFQRTAQTLIEEALLAHAKPKPKQPAQTITGELYTNPNEFKG